MVNGWSALSEASAPWDVRESESKKDSVRRPRTRIPVPTSTAMFLGPGFAKRGGMRITTSFLLLALCRLLPVQEARAWSSQLQIAGSDTVEKGNALWRWGTTRSDILSIVYT